MTAAPPPPPELHLPDLPEVAVHLGPLRRGDDPAPRPELSWRWRVRQAVSSYLPLLLMAFLAGSTWWLVRNTPSTPGPAATTAQRHDPDYTMGGFSISRFGPDGRLVLRIDGDQMRHYPDTDRLEVDAARIHAIGADGRITDATARRALANGDGSEVQLLGGAHVVSRLGGAPEIEFQGEFLHAFVRFERLRSHLPVQVRQGTNVMHAGALDYDNLQQRLQLGGPVRATLWPGRRAVTPAAATPRGGAASAP